MSLSVFRYSAVSQGMVLVFGLDFVFVMAVLLEVARKLDRHRDVSILRSLVPARDQDDQCFATANEVHAIAGTVVDPHLRHAAAHRLHVAGVAERHSPDPGIDARLRSIVVQARQPSRKNLRLSDLGHRPIYSRGSDSSSIPDG